MIKRVIFDIDNTLIKWEDTYYEKLGQVFEELQMSYTQADIENVVIAIEEYEKREVYFQKEAMHKIIEEKMQKEIQEDFVDTMLTYFTTCVPEKLPDEIVDALEYLSNKYELVTLSNWFEEQEIRLEKVGIRKYFKECFACEKIKMKPNKESYQTAIGPYKPEECIMIGDSLRTDIQGALNCNLQAIYYNPKEVQTEYRSIRSFTELKEML